MSRAKWFVLVVSWDGCLPLLVAIVPSLLAITIANRVLLELASFLFVPFAAALVRAHAGRRQLSELAGTVTVLRQVLLAGAILVLLVFEGLVGVLQVGAGVPDLLWLVAGVFYLVYLALVVPALYPKHWEKGASADS